MRISLSDCNGNNSAAANKNVINISLRHLSKFLLKTDENDKKDIKL
jgi:hypothetical protein